MFRQYEDPYALEERLEEVLAKREENPDDDWLAIEEAELRDRINYAWQDDEYDAEYSY